VVASKKSGRENEKADEWKTVKEGEPFSNGSKKVRYRPTIAVFHGGEWLSIQKEVKRKGDKDFKPVFRNAYPLNALVGSLKKLGALK